MKSPFRLIALSALMLLLLSACSAPAAAPEEPTTPPEAPQATATHTHEATPTQPTAAEPTDAPAETEASGPQPPQVDIINLTFVPETLTISVGTTVTWTNHSPLPHTVTADDGTFASEALTEGDSFSFTFTQAGTYHYFCEFHGAAGHSGMSGTIVVE